MARNRMGIDQSFGRAQVIPDQRYRSPAWEYHIANRDALKKKMSADKAEFEEMDDLKAWEDDRNFKEITGEMRDLEKIWNQSFSAGYNIANPSTEKEQILAKKFTEKRDKVKQASDLYARQGDAVKSAWDAMQEKGVDKGKTRQKIMDYVDYEGDIFERAKQVPNLVVYEKEPVDIIKTISEGISQYTTVEKSVMEDAIDPETGKIKKITWTGIPAAKRAEALEQIWSYSSDDFKEGVKDVMMGDISNNLDPNKKEDLHDYFIKEFKNVKSGSKVEETFYSLAGGGFGISIGSGIPKKDAQGMFVGNPDTVLIHNTDQNGPVEHTSPYAINFQGVFKATPSDAVAVDVTEDLINTQDGLPEEKAGNYSILPTKVIWLPVSDEDVDLNTQASPWKGPIQNIFYPNTAYKNKPITDKQFGEIEKINDRLTGSGTRIGYRWVPYFMVRTKYGLVEQGDDISSFNRSDYVPYGVIKDDIKAKVNSMKDVDWNEYEQAISEISEYLNSNIFDPRKGKKKKFDY